MTSAPAYFEAIRQKAVERWNQLETDAELAGPWHQLFKQVQSPRHILSELLQNADDAGATEASVCVENGVFSFEHNGEDFKQEHFASLCRFGYSNKRALHTIGFRGIGFKSTFSLGDCVEVFTPTLSVAFNRRRFTEPAWIAGDKMHNGRTRIRVAILDVNRQREVERNLAEWRESPVSLLFFKHIRSLRIDDHELQWEAIGAGPVANSVRMSLNGAWEPSYLLVRSSVEPFPDEALEEIRQERMLDSEDQDAFPPCSVDLVLGTTGRLFVVLPTGVETALPFACNAPFVQDPARLKVKDPETSPTNRWLLERCGMLAATAMLEWLSSADVSEEEKARAYALLPDVDREASSLEGVCAAICEEAFHEAITGCKVLLSEVGDVRAEKECVVIPRQIHDAWSPMLVASRFDKLGRPSLSAHVSIGDRKKLRSWGMIDEIDKPMILALLRDRTLPKPGTWSQLLSLWTYLAPEFTGYRYFQGSEKLRIVPVSGGAELRSASEVVRLGDKTLLQSGEDWDFVRALVTIVSEDWIDYLAKQRLAIQHDPKQPGAEALAAADAVFVKLGLALPSDLTKVFGQVAATFFATGERTVADCARVAQIAARLSANVASSFRYATRDCKLRLPSHGLYFDVDGRLETLLPESRQDSQLLHAGYEKSFTSCTRDEWASWIRAGYSGLLIAPQISARKQTFRYASGFVKALREIVPAAPQPTFPYTTGRNYTYQSYTIRDFDFDGDCIPRWNALEEAENVWGEVVGLLCNAPTSAWKHGLLVEAEQTSTNGQSAGRVNIGAVPSAWIRRLRMLPCLPDTRGSYRKPEELLRRTASTEALMGIEAFLDHRVDRVELYPLLDALGVRSTASGPERLLDALRALAKTATPPVSEVDKWYRKIDQFVETCSTTDSAAVQAAFGAEKLVFSRDGEWATAADAYQSAGDDDIPGVPLIRLEVLNLSLWRRIGVAERPTVDLALAWLGSLDVGVALSAADLRRVRALMVRYPVRIWQECAHWLNLQGEWVPIATLKYALTMQSLVPWAHLFPSVKQKTADLQRLSGEVTRDAVFANIPLLAASIDERFKNQSLFGAQYESKEWLKTVGIELSRIALDSGDEAHRIQALAIRLATTKWVESRALDIVPYIDGMPAGTPRLADVVWIDERLFVEPQPRAKLAKRVPEEISKQFNRQDIRSALDYCFERSVDEVRDYLRENFTLTHVEPNERLSTTVASDVPCDTEDVADLTVSDHASLSDGKIESATQAKESGVEATSTEESAADDSTGDVAKVQFQKIELRPATHSRPNSLTEQPSLVERYALLHGFRRNGTGGFVAVNREQLVRASTSPFGWEHRAADGRLLRSFYVKEHCLEHSPLQLESEVWGMLEKFPATHAMLLLDLNANPVEITGTLLRTLRDAGKISLYPAAYRLVFEQPRNA